MTRKIVLTIFMFVSMLGSAWGSGFPDTYGFGVRATALGNAFTAVADDFSAAHYNPAGLSQMRGHEVSLNVMYTSPQFEVTTLNGMDLRTIDATGGIRTDPTQTQYDHGMDLPIIMLGAVLDVNRIATKLPVNVQFGLGISMPQMFDSGYQMNDFPPDQPHFIRYGDNIDRMTLAMGLGVEVVENLLHLGAGLNVMLSGPGTFHIDSLQNILSSGTIDVANQSEFGALWVYEPSYGILLTPFDGKLKIGYSYDHEYEMHMGPIPIMAQMKLGFNLPVTMMLDINSFFTPAEHRVGLAVDMDNFLLSFDVAQQLWSNYKYSMTDMVNFYPGNSELTAPIPETGSPNFDDTINYYLGFEYRFNDDWSLLAGLSHVPTPVPDQSWRISNYIDRDRNTLSLGCSYVMRPSFMVPDITITGMFQYQNLEDITVYKDGVDGWSNWTQGSSAQQSYKVEGDAFAGGISFNMNW